MRFRNVNRTLIADDEESTEFVDSLVENATVDLASMDYMRSNAQNKRLWPALNDISKHVVWFGVKHDTDTWKHILSAAWRSQTFVNGIGNSLVVIPVRTSKMNKKEFGEFLTSIMAFGDEKGVPWSDPAIQIYSTYKEANA